jgi:hypothetical protein
MQRTRIIRRLLTGGARGIGGTVYGTVLALAALTAGAAEDLGAAKLAVVVSATAFVIWIAHVYSHGLGESIERGQRLTRDELSSIAVREMPILAAAAAPTAILVLGAVGLVKESTDIWLAFGVGLAALAAQGIRYARVEKLGSFGTAKAVALNLALGGIVVGLKVAVTHY